MARKKMTDSELSRKLWHYQRLASRCLAVGLIGATGGVVSFFAVRDTALRAILVAVLFFGGICCAIFLSGGARSEATGGVRTGSAAFDQRFRVTAEPEQDAFCLLTPQFLQLTDTLAQDTKGTLLGFCWDGEVFSLAMDTDYAFAAVAGTVDLCDLDAVRRRYQNSLRAIEALLDLLLADAELFAAQA